VSTFIDNWLAAITSGDVVMLANGVADSVTRDRINGYLQSAIATRPRSIYYDYANIGRGDDYIAAQGWDDPDAVHFDSEFWNAIAADIYQRVFAGSTQAVTGQFIGRDGTLGRVIRFGSPPKGTDPATRYEFSVSRSNRGAIGLRGSLANGADAYFDWEWLAPQGSGSLNQVRMRLADELGLSYPMQIDRNGNVAFGAVGTASASTKGSHIWIKSASAANKALRTESSGTLATEIAQEWGNGTAGAAGTTATMSGLGLLKFDGLSAGISIKAQTNGRAGTGATLASGTVTVDNTSVTANSHIIITKTAHGGTGGTSYVVTKSAGTSFTITAVDTAGATVTTDTSVFDWAIIERH
jgi:hypothetical protein